MLYSSTNEQKTKEILISSNNWKRIRFQNNTHAQTCTRTLLPFLPHDAHSSYVILRDTIFFYNQTTKTNQNIKLKSRENYLNIEVKLHSDMGKLNNVYIIESMFIEEFNRIKENG